MSVVLRCVSVLLKCCLVIVYCVVWCLVFLGVGSSWLRNVCNWFLGSMLMNWLIGCLLVNVIMCGMLCVWKCVVSFWFLLMLIFMSF